MPVLTVIPFSPPICCAGLPDKDAEGSANSSSSAFLICMSEFGLRTYSSTEPTLPSCSALHAVRPPWRSRLRWPILKSATLRPLGGSPFSAIESNGDGSIPTPLDEPLVFDSSATGGAV